jgi:hypothetical protein
MTRFYLRLFAAEAAPTLSMNIEQNCGSQVFAGAAHPKKSTSTSALVSCADKQEIETPIE